jgi:RNA polymerase sigma-70 factor (ECF subfamily)
MTMDCQSLSRRFGRLLRCKEVEPDVGQAYPDDAELAARWQRGDAQAFAELVRRWQQPIARFLTHFLGRADNVRDLCQEVFLRAFIAGPRYRECGKFSAWLYRIALNAARDSSRRSQLATVSIEEHEPASAVPAPDEQNEQREVSRIVSAALADLPQPLRLVLVLRHYEDMSFEDIARLTATPASTLKSRFATALNHLRIRLRHLDPAEEHQP